MFWPYVEGHGGMEDTEKTMLSFGIGEQVSSP